MQKVNKTGLVVCLIFLFVFLSVMVIPFSNCATENYWSIGNNCYFAFDKSINLITEPSKGVSVDNGLIGWWTLNEQSGTTAYDSSSNQNNGYVNGSLWVDGKYGNALLMDGVSNYLEIPDNASIRGDIWTVSMWINRTAQPSSSDFERLFSKGGANYGRYFQITPTTHLLQAGFSDVNGVNHYVTGSKPMDSRNWHNCVFIFDGYHLQIYLDGRLDADLNLGQKYVPQSTSGYNMEFCRAQFGTSQFYYKYSGLIDDIRLYNRALTSGEVSTIYSNGQYAQPDQVSYANYYNFTDSASNNVLLINADHSTLHDDNSVLITCTSFFENNCLLFSSNNSVVVNLWTNLGKPAFTNGTWNEVNYTTTLELNPSSSIEVNWNRFNISVYSDLHSSAVPGNITVDYRSTSSFIFNTTQGYRFDVAIDGTSLGQIYNYTFVNVTTIHSITVTSWAFFFINSSCSNNGSITPAGSVAVDSGQSQRFDFIPDQGYNLSKLLVDNVSQPLTQYYVFSNVSKNHSIIAYFESNLCYITALTDKTSLINPGNVSVAYGDFKHFYITAMPGYRISRVCVDGEDVGSLTTFNFTDVTANHTIAVFSISSSSPVGTLSSVYSDDEQSASININWIGNNSLHGGGYIFSTNNTGQWINSSWTPFSMDSSWGNVTLKLNNAAGAIVAFREYANDSVGLWGDSGLYTLIANSSAPISTPTITVSASSTFAPSASQSVQPSPSASQSQQPTLPSSSTEAAGFPTETVLFVAAIVTAIIVVLALAFKKKYITIETVNEAAHSSQSESAESRTKPRPEEELENYPQAINYAVEKLVALLSAANLPAKEPTVSKPCAIFVEGLYVVDEKILLLKRNVAPFKGYWHVVGGEVARDESLYSALSREYKEETGLDIEIGKVVGSRVEETLDRTKFIIALEITSAKGTIKLNNENSESYWFGQIPLNSVFDYGKYLRKVV